MKLSELVAQYVAGQPAGVVLTPETITQALRDAVRKYCGYAVIKSAPPVAPPPPPGALPDPYAPPVHTPVDHTSVATGTQDFVLNPSELAIIEPLWKLYIERDNATNLEASRGLGLDVYGRDSATIAADITSYEERLPRLAFMEPPLTV